MCAAQQGQGQHSRCHGCPIRVDGARSAHVHGVHMGAERPRYSTCMVTATKWQTLPPITNRCQIACE